MPAFGNNDALDDARAAIDRRLIQAMADAQAGDRAAYEVVLRECVPIVQRIARQKGASADFVDDVVQDVLVTIHGARQTYDPSRSFIAWLTAITQRRTIDIMRKRGRKSAREVHAPLAYDTHPADDDPEQVAERRGEARALRAMVSELPAVQREAVMQLALGEKSLEDASISTGRTKSALKVNLHRAIKSLRGRMGVSPDPRIEEKDDV